MPHAPSVSIINLYCQLNKGSDAGCSAAIVHAVNEDDSAKQQTELSRTTDSKVERERGLIKNKATAMRVAKSCVTKGQGMTWTR